MAKLKVIERKLGRERSWGLYWCGQNRIELEASLRGRRRLQVLLHEALHHILPNASENSVERKSQLLASLLWKQGYRRVDNRNR